MIEIAPITQQVTINITAHAHAVPAAGGYSAEVPALPGCYSQAETLEELRANIRDAAEAWLAVAHDLAIQSVGREYREFVMSTDHET